MFWQNDRSIKHLTRKLYQEYFNRLEEAGFSSIRIPLPWELLQAVDSSVSTLYDNVKEVERLQEILQMVPRSVSVLGVLLNPADRIAAAYFEDQSIMPDLIETCTQSCVNNFPDIQKWEIWNEPNASDFYLYIRNNKQAAKDSGTGHRPRTAGEFLDHILIPGSRAIKSLKEDARICIGGFAENGLVDHNDRKPTRINRLS